MSFAEEESEIESLSNGTAFKCWPAMRNEYRKHSYDAYCDGDTDRAILYDSKSLSCGFVGTQLNADASVESVIHDQDISKTIHLQKNTVNPLVDYLSDHLNGFCVVTTSASSTDHVGTIDDQRQIDDLFKQCDKLPPEWNVIQLTQMYDGYNGYATKKDMYNSGGPIVLTLFRYNLAEKRNKRAISIIPDSNEESPKNVSTN